MPARMARLVSAASPDSGRARAVMWIRTDSQQASHC